MRHRAGAGDAQPDRRLDVARPRAAGEVRRPRGDQARVRPVAAAGAEVVDRPAGRRLRRSGRPSTPPGSDSRSRRAGTSRPTAPGPAGPRPGSAARPERRPSPRASPRRRPRTEASPSQSKNAGSIARERPASAGSPRSARPRTRAGAGRRSPARARRRPGRRGSSGSFRTNISNVARSSSLPSGAVAGHHRELVEVGHRPEGVRVGPERDGGFMGHWRFRSLNGVRGGACGSQRSTMPRRIRPDCVARRRARDRVQGTRSSRVTGSISTISADRRGRSRRVSAARLELVQAATRRVADVPRAGRGVLEHALPGSARGWIGYRPSARGRRPGAGGAVRRLIVAPRRGIIRGSVSKANAAQRRERRLEDRAPGERPGRRHADVDRGRDARRRGRRPRIRGAAERRRAPAAFAVARSGTRPEPVPAGRDRPAIRSQPTACSGSQSRAYG